MARRRAHVSDASSTLGPSTPPAHSTDAEEELEADVPPFFNTTFSTHRVSPLYIGPQELDQTRLDALAHRLRDTLVGDMVRGIQVGLEAADTPVGQVGPLKTVRFRWFRAGDVLGDEEALGGLAQVSEEQKQGLWIEIRHENASYAGLLLPAMNKETMRHKAPVWAMQAESHVGEADPSQFVHLPLLLLKMPLALKSIVSDWLSATFDCRVSRLSLGTKTLVRVWEGWMQVAGLASQSADLVVTLAFHAPLAPKNGDHDGAASDDGLDEPGLRSMDISIPSSELQRFLRAGEALCKDDNRDKRTKPWDGNERKTRRLAGPNVDDGWAWRRNRDESPDPFTEALADYLDHHLALNLFHPSVRVVQVSCGGFMLAQSRIKITRQGDGTEALARAAWMVVMRLGERIRGGEMPSIT